MEKIILDIRNKAQKYALDMNPEENSYGGPANPKKFESDRDSKFAELLILECVNQITQTDRVDSFQALNIARDIKKYFSVK